MFFAGRLEFSLDGTPHCSLIPRDDCPSQEPW